MRGAPAPEEPVRSAPAPSATPAQKPVAAAITTVPAPTETESIPIPEAAPARSKGKRALPTASLPTIKLPAVKLPFRRREKPPESEAADTTTGLAVPAWMSRLPLPDVSGRTAAAVIGTVIGFGLVLSTAGVLRGCEALRGTKSCGGAGGFTLLLVLIVAAVYVGALLLRLFKIPDPGSTSFLAVGIVVVLAMIIFIDSLLDWWMFIVIPIMSAGAYVLSHYVTTALVEPALDQHRDQRVD